jgi:hypothetical protein
MENEHKAIIEKLNAQEAQITAILTSVEKTRKYLLVSMWITLGITLVPLLIGIIVVPMVINSYLATFEGLL